MSSTTDNPALVDTTWLDRFDLNPRQRAFVLDYLADPNGKKAAISAGYAKGSAEVTASKLLSNTKVARAIAEGRKQVESRAMLEAEGIVNLWTQIATANPNELTQHIIAPCRYCHGIYHRYQWKSEREFTEDKARVVFSQLHDERERRCHVRHNRRSAHPRRCGFLRLSSHRPAKPRLSRVCSGTETKSPAWPTHVGSVQPRASSSMA